jgi:quercetin dioxygenase-like cupin family protein
MRRVSLAAVLFAIPAATVVLDNPHARVFHAAGTLAGVDNGPGVVISLEDGPGGKAGSAVWMENVGSQRQSTFGTGSLIIVQPRRAAAPPVVAPPAAAPPAVAPPRGSAPGESPFTGMSFRQLFENDRVTVIRARMEVGAREAFHTHGSDTIVVHLSGGSIEDTAGGKTTVNRWKRGDVEFEARGSSHSARNVGQAVDVVLVALKP